MNKTAIKNFAIWSRNKLIADVKYRAGLMGITENGIASALPQSTGTTEFYDIGTADPYVISGDEIKQRKTLVETIRQNEVDSDYLTAYMSIIEEVAYSWFNRLIAIRFMEVNDYLPSHIRVLSSETGKKEPDIVTNPFDSDLEFIEKEKDYIRLLKDGNKMDELFRFLFIKQCNALNEILPALFEKTSDYSEFLFNISYVDQDGVVAHLITDIEEDDFNVEKGGQVEIIGWLYQYYNTELNEQVYDGSFSKEKVKKELIPAATTIYTPDWPIRYMVENSLGRYCVENGIVSRQNCWQYFLPFKGDVNEKTINIEEVRFLDPCMGSGHILVYAFDVFMNVYEALGYTQREAAKIIIEKNIFGFDIDDRAYQMSYFAVIMKARQYNRRLFQEQIQCNLYAIRESNSINEKHLEVIFGNKKKEFKEFLDYLIDAKEYGSILKISSYDWDEYKRQIDAYVPEGQFSLDTVGIENTIDKINYLINLGEALSLQYHVVCTNPPYLGSGRFDAKLDKYVKEHYDDVKSDLSMVVYKKAMDDFSLKNGYISFITTSSWLTLSSFEKLRVYAQKKITLSSIVDFGTELSEGKAGHNPIVAWTAKNVVENHYGTAIRLVDFCYSQRDEKEKQFFNEENWFEFLPSNFEKLPGNPISYWVTEHTLSHFEDPRIGDTYISGGRNKTHNNDKYLRVWWEIANTERWQPYDKGGDFRKWYGNHDYFVDWSEAAKQEYASHGGLYNQSYAGKVGICWSLVTSYKTSFRVKLDDNHYDSGAPVIFNDNFTLDEYVLALLNSVVGGLFLKVLNPSVNMGNTYVLSVPMIRAKSIEEELCEKARKCIEISKEDWDCFEKSWGFSKHPLIRKTSLIQTAYEEWMVDCQKRFDDLKTYEEYINKQFIDIYGLHDELSAEVIDKDVTVSKADLQRDIKSFLSYAVGCMFGRYSVDYEGLAYVGGDWDSSKYISYIPDIDNIIPISDEEYLEDDIVVRLCEFIKVVYGEDSLEENLDFIAKALGNKGDTSRDIIRDYFLNDFYKDHCQAYSVTGSGKRPIYWLFESGKQSGFKALIYIHRYTVDTIGNLRIDYLHRMQKVYESEIDRMQDMMDHSSNGREISVATKRKEKLTKQLKECRDYDEKIGHLALERINLNLDDGVRYNYRKMQSGSDGKVYEVLAESKNIMMDLKKYTEFKK